MEIMLPHRGRTLSVRARARYTRTASNLEARIKRAHAELIAAPDRAGRIAAWQQMLALIRSRSLEQIRALEIKRGLR